MQEIDYVSAAKYAVNHISDTARHNKRNCPKQKSALFAVFDIKNYANNHYHKGNGQQYICAPVQHSPRAAAVVNIGKVNKAA